MRFRTLRSSAGFTYIAALALVVIVGILAAQTANYWKLTAQRERETELIFRGTQIRDAMRRWYGMPLTANGLPAPVAGATTSTTGTQAAPSAIPAGAPQLNELKDLLQAPVLHDSKVPVQSRALRREYLDPMSGKNDWHLEKDGNQKIIGVSSLSEAEPIKQKGFPFDLEPSDFEQKKKYSEWKFLCTRYPKPAVAGGVKGLTTSAPGATSTSPPGVPPAPTPPAQ
jgi:type II secretory pathway pseudopilin PulG